MAYARNTANTQFDFNNIQELLITRLKKSPQQFPEHFSKHIYVLPAISDNVEFQLEQQLQQEREDHTGKRIILIPYYLEKSHWVGILVEFQADEKIQRAEYINPVNGPNVVPDRLQKQFVKVYRYAILQPRDLFKHNDRELSSALTIQNLLAAAANDQHSDAINQEVSQLYSIIPDENKTSTYSTERESLNSPKEDNTIPTSTTHIPNEGNRYKLQELEQKFHSGLTKRKIKDAVMLSEEIQKTSKLIDKYEEEEKTEDMKREVNSLSELEQLRNLWDEINILKCASPNPSPNDKPKVHELQEKLNRGLAKINLHNMDELVEEIRDTEERIQKFEKQGRKEKAQEEMKFLEELQELKELSDRITKLNINAPVSSVGHESELRELREKLNNGLARIKLQNVDELPEEIQDTEQLIEQFEKQGRKEKAQEEREFLHELRELQELSDKIIKLASNVSISPPDHELELRELRERLNSGLAKINLQNVEELQEEIMDTEKRIQAFEMRGRKEKAEEEMIFFRELQELKELSGKIIKLTSNASISPPDHESELRELRERLNSGLAKIKLQNVDELPGEIKDTEERVQKFEKRGRKEKAQKETEFLRELGELKELSDKVTKLLSNTPAFAPDDELKHREQHDEFDSKSLENNLQNTTEYISTSIPPALDIDEPFTVQSQCGTPTSTDRNTATLDDQKKKLLYIKELRNEADAMPTCARKTTIELLVYFEQKLLGESTAAHNEDTVISLLQKLKEQVKKEELLSENVKSVLHDLEMYITNDNYSVVVRYLNELLKKFSSLNVSEIQRLVAKAKEAAELIHNQDVILLIGTTGAGKSTTIQFLAGATMKEVRVEIRPGKYLEHVTAVGPIKNPDLNNVNSSPLQKSETRYIAPVTVQLKDILGAHETGIITLCDAPGFDDTAGPEVDIANSIGVIEALKATKSVKLLALSSYKGLGDKGQGVQKLAHILISMVHEIEDKLDAIFYAFTKYPETTDINALLLDIKRSKVDEDVTLRSDTAFVTVLSDMIDKTEDGAYKIEPTRDEPKKLIKKLKNIRGIRNPEEVFRFSMSEETRANIVDHIQRDKFSIICAMKYKDNDLVLYYLNDLQLLKDLIKESFIRDTYEESVRFVSENISEYCTEIMKKFNRALASQDGLQEKDILDYQKSIKYLHQAQILKEHLGSSLLSPASMLQNIITELNGISRNLNEEELHSPLVTIYLDNLCMLKNSFTELEENYSSTCKKFEKRFHELVQTTRELIPNNNFKEIAEILLNIFQSARLLKNHLHGQVQEVYSDIVKYLLRYLNSFSEKAEPLLARVRLSNEEVETIKNYMEILRSAKENAALQERVSSYLEMLKKKVEVSDEHYTSGEKSKNLNEIYDEFIVKIIKYFDEINRRIKELFDRNGDHALEHIKTLVNDMDALRTIPELESKTAGTYYHTVENIRGYMQQLQGEVEKLLIAIDQQSGITNYKHLARSLSRLKNAEWINEVSPGTYDNLMRRITEELIQYACQLEDSLMKIDFTLKCPENVSVAKEIVDKIESMRDLERSIPELEKYRNNIVKRFLQCIQAAFDRIQKTFDLQDKDVYQIKQKLKELEEIKREYENLHPARIYLQKQGYSDANMLDNEIEELKSKQKAEREVKEAAECEKKSELDKLKTIVQNYVIQTSTETNQGMIKKMTSKIGLGVQDKSAQSDAYLQKLGYSRIELVYEEISKVDKIHRNKLQRIQDQDTELSHSLRRLESIKKEHDLLLATRHSTSEETNFLREKGFNSYELLDEAIQEKTKVINKRGKNKQIYHFSDRLDASTANNAIVYIHQCEKVGQDRVREDAIDANENLRKYIREYGMFLKQEISRNFNSTRSIGIEEGPFSYSQDLEMRLQELLSFNKFQHVFECINGAETVEHWHQEFLDFHRSLSAKMEEYKVAGKLKELKDQLIIAQALTCVDRFCATVFAGNGFGALYRQYQGEINRECKVAYRTVLDHISKGDYARADIALSDIEDNPLNQKDMTQIQHDLQCSLNKLMKDTITIANWLDGKIEREDNRDQIIEIKENIDKIRIACNKHTIMELLDSTTQTNLRAFDNEINENLSGIILRGLNSIEAFMDADSFSEAEQGTETLSRVQRELTGYCTLPSVTEKSKELRERLDSIVTKILKGNNFDDVNTYSVNPPKDILDKLKKVASHGNARFTQAYTSMLGKIRQTFILAIEEARTAPLNERSVKIRSLNYALYFLPEDLQTQFKLQIDELSKLVVDEETAHKRDLETLFTNVDEDEHAIKKIGLLAAKYSE